VVIGAGWAGDGHTTALRWCGVEVAAICGRDPGVVGRVAERLSIAEASTDWRETLDRVRPDIVTIGTPAALRLDVVEVALSLGCHVLCEKPLAVGCLEAEQMYHLARDAGVKHAYASTHRYDPSVAWLAELVCDGAIGRLTDVVGTFRSSFPPVLPYSWALESEQGGGLLNNAFTHDLGILARIVGGEPVRAMGRAQTVHAKAPVVPGTHDFRQWLATAYELTPERVTSLEWRPFEADLGYDAILELASPAGRVGVTVAAGPGVPGPSEVDGWRLHGESGTLQADAQGMFAYSTSRVRARGEAPEPLPTPQRLVDDLPRVGDDVENKWCALVRDFVADVKGERHQPYLTFRDGWRYQVAIDAIRSGAGWRELPA